MDYTQAPLPRGWGLLLSIKTESYSVARLECSGVISAHCDLRLPETGFHYFDQAGLELLTSGDPPALASQSARIT
ncbi:Zinc finger protein, partial [Plecturocebus cupreus]